MRIVAGKHKGRTLKTPNGRDTRPTSDRAREAIFNVLEHAVPGPGLQGARVIDVFAGTGALGLEALSRGAQHATFVEPHRGAIACISENIRTLGENDTTKILPIKAAQLPSAKDGPVDYAFLDAPYHKDLSTPALENLAHNGWLHDGSVLMVEVAKDENLIVPQSMEVIKEKCYGAARVLFMLCVPS